MTARGTHAAPAVAAGPGAAAASQVTPGGLRLVRLYAASRRVPAAVAAIAACAIGLRIALIGHWDTYGALQLPLVFETAAAAVIAVTTASPFGEPERVTGRWLPYLRLATTLALTAAAVGALAAAGAGAHLAGGTLDVLRNVAGMTGIGLLCAAALGGGLAWIGPVAYLVAGVLRALHPVASPGADHALALARPGRRTTSARRSAPGWCSPPGLRPLRCAEPAIRPVSRSDGVNWPIARRAPGG